MNEKNLIDNVVRSFMAKKGAEEKWNVYGRRDGKMGKWNDKPMSKKDAEDLMRQIEKAKIPSVDIRSLEMKLASDVSFMAKKGLPDALKKHQFTKDDPDNPNPKGNDRDGDGKTNEPKPEFLKKEKKEKKSSEDRIAGSFVAGRGIDRRQAISILASLLDELDSIREREAKVIMDAYDGGLDTDAFKSIERKMNVAGRTYYNLMEDYIHRAIKGW
jgi:hypothetical protein